MDVSVLFKPGHRWLRSPKKPSVLGGGLLERARSTTLALLGVTTAVGLAMVALALNQSWPLVADSPIPGAPSQEAIGKATVAAQAKASIPGFGLAGAAVAPRSNAARPASGGDTGGARAPEVGSVPTASTELVVGPSAPATPQGDAPPTTGKPTPAPSPVENAPQAPAASVPGPAQPEPAPQSPPAVETSPPATSAEAPIDSSADDDWSDDDDDDWDDDDWDDDDDWGDHGGHGHHWSHGRHDD